MVEVNNLTAISINEELLKKIAKKVLRREKIKDKAGLSIAFVGPRRIKEINKRYRGRNRVTDVLSFPEPKTLKERFKVGLRRGIQSLGEIVICPIKVKKNAKIFSSTFEGELAKVLIHGILHLLDYNHEKSEEAAKKMKKKEEHYLSQI